MKKARMRLITPLVAIALLAGCASSSPDDAPRCRLTFSGNTAGTASLAAACASVEQTSDGRFVLHLDAGSDVVPAFAARIDLGPDPAPGTLSPATVASWSASGVSAADATCIFAAGSASAPAGAFTLELDAVEARDGGAAHGTLELFLTVHAPPATDCGGGDTEQATVRF